MDIQALAVVKLKRLVGGGVRAAAVTGVPAQATTPRGDALETTAMPPAWSVMAA